MAIEEKYYSTSNLNELMGKYQFPVQELALFNAALTKFNESEILNKEGKIIFIDEIYFYGATPGGGTMFESESISFPESGTLAAMPVTSFAGGTTFAFYDEYSVVVHELSHFILDLLGTVYFGNNKFFDDSKNGAELNQAVIAAAWRQSGGDLDTLVNKLTTWSPSKKIEIATHLDSSFENIFNYSRSFYSDVAGISNAPIDLIRNGYQSHLSNGQWDGVWHDYQPADRTSILGNYQNILTTNSEGIVVLGNQYDNNAAVFGASFQGIMFDSPKIGENSLIGTATHNDYLDGGNGNDYLDGKGGDDILIGGAGDDEIHGGTDNDTIYGGRSDGIDDNGNDILYGDGGNDTMYGGGGNDILIADKGNDTLYGDKGADELYGGEGNDILYAGEDNDQLYGGKDDDTLYGGNGNDIVYGEGGNDTLRGESGDDAIKGGDGDDSLYGGIGSDILSGGAGNDTLNGGAGSDTLFGEVGNDVYVIDTIGDTICEKFDEGNDTVQSSISYTLTANVENLILTGLANINGTGNSLNNTLKGNSGANILNGGAGTDTLFGGAGNDTYYVDNVGDKVYETTTAVSGIDSGGIDLVNTTISYTLGSFVENLTLTGTSNINGTGNSLNNTLTGNSGANILNGGAGVDTLFGGVGNDTLVGGAGRDSFVFNTALNGTTNKDTITDFTATDDIIKLENGIYTKLATVGTLAMDNFYASATGVAHDANDYIVYNTASGILSYDADGNGAGSAIAFATLVGHPTISYTNFAVI